MINNEVWLVYAKPKKQKGFARPISLMNGEVAVQSRLIYASMFDKETAKRVAETLNDQDNENFYEARKNG